MELAGSETPVFVTEGEKQAPCSRGFLKVGDLAKETFGKAHHRVLYPLSDTGHHWIVNSATEALCNF